MQLLKCPLWSLITTAQRKSRVLDFKRFPGQSLFTQTQLEVNEEETFKVRQNQPTVEQANSVVDETSLDERTKTKSRNSHPTTHSNHSESMVKESSNAGFDETIEACFSLNIDDRKPEQRIKDKILYPVSPIKHTFVAVFTKDPQEIEAAQEAKADYIGYEELLERIKKRRFKFYWLVSTPSSVKGLSSVSKILGPRGMMPTEKMGTLTVDIDLTVRELKKGYLRIENDPDSNVHSVLGKKSWSTESLLTNCCYLYEFLSSKKHRTIKKNYFMGLTLSSTMGPGIRVDLNSIRDLVNKNQQDKTKHSSTEISMSA
ncbi:50S ribosomal protein L1 [Galdieria sulphuraria]|nr:50S ribosomal protein L1 [Galdieria sulphuraria]